MNTEARFEEYLFKSHMNSQFTRQGCQLCAEEIWDESQTRKKPTLIPDDLTAHKMRHTAAMEHITSGVDLMYIRDLLGHSSVMTTEIYARTDAKLKRKAIEAASKEILPKEEAKWNLIPI